MGRVEDIELARLRFSIDSCRSVALTCDEEQKDSTRLPQVAADKKFRHVPYLLLSFIFLFSLGDSIESIPLLQVWRFFLCQDATSDRSISIHSREANDFAESPVCHTPNITLNVAKLDGWIISVGMLLSVASSLFWGRACDVKGRRWTFRICAIGTVISQALSVVAIWAWPLSGHMGLYFASLVGGAFGAPAALVSVSYAILSDVLAENERLIWFMRTIGVWYAARIIGPSIGAWLLSVQLILPVYTATGFVLLSLFLLNWLPETSRIDYMPKSSSRFVLLQELKVSLSSFTLCLSTPNLTIIAMTNFSYFFGISIIPILTIYVNSVLEWSMQEAGYLSSFQAVLKCVSAIFIVPCLRKLCTLWQHRHSDTVDLRITTMSLLVDGVSWLMIAILPSRFLLSSIALGCLGVGATSSMRALASTQVPTKDHGRLFAALGVVDALAATVAAPSMASLYSVSVALPELVFVFVGFIFSISALAYHWYSPNIMVQEDEDPAVNEVLFQAMT